MRKKIQEQLPIVYPFIDHEHARELRKISDILDQIPLAGELVYDDLTSDGPDVSVGRLGLSGDQVLGFIRSLCPGDEHRITFDWTRQG